MKLLNESGGGKLYESNGFIVPVLTGMSTEMGTQYGVLMAERMQETWDVLVEPGLKAGQITDKVMRRCTDRAYTTCSTRMRQFYDGVAKGSGWPLDKVGMLDQLMELGIYQSKIHSFAGCTSILSWGSHSADGNRYAGRNLDWGPGFNKFPQILTVLRPTDGSYKYATTGWPGMYSAFTALNEHGVFLDVHDGTSISGSVVYEERPSILNVLWTSMGATASWV
ncbi:MAG: C45 family autoproteolytic acyltransferase/hydrolase [Acidobacteriota bacterium]